MPRLAYAGLEQAARAADETRYESAQGTRRDGRVAIAGADSQISGQRQPGSKVRRHGCRSQARWMRARFDALLLPPSRRHPRSRLREGKAVAVQSLAGGAERITYRIGPFDIEPGQNNIANRSADHSQQPQDDGWIVGIRPNLDYPNGSMPRRRRHPPPPRRLAEPLRQDADRPSSAGALLRGRRGEDDLQLPPGYGYPYKTTDHWLLNYMMHNLTPDRDQVWVTYDIDFIPATRPRRAGIRPVRPDLDGRAERQHLPGVRRARGQRARTASTRIPTTRRTPTAAAPTKNEWTVDQPTACSSATAGHVHPGGLHTDLKRATRGGKTRATVPVASRTTTSRPAPSRGTSRCRRRRPTGGCR